MGYAIRKFDGPIADPSLHAAHNAFDNALLYEKDPTFGSRRLEDTAVKLSHPRADWDVTRWFVLEGDTMIATAELILDLEDAANLHLGWVDGGVLPSHRRKGVGTRLLRAIAAEASAAGRAVLMTETVSLVPAGAKFMTAIGAEAGLVERVSQLLIDELDLDQMDRWIERGRSQRDRFELVWLEGPWPRDMLDDVVALAHVMNDAPFGSLDLNEQAFTPTHIIAEEEEIFARGFTRLTAAVKERAGGRMVGYTQLFINPSFPDLGQQGDTGVLEEVRGNGLGKWIKAEVARHVVAELPQITRIRTGNAHSNAPMLAINEQMGFQLHHVTTVWQIDTAAAKDG